MLSQQDILARLARASALRTTGQYEPAAEICREILSYWPNHGDAIHLLGMIAAQSGDKARGIDLLRKAAVLKPNDPEVLMHLSMTLLTTGQAVQAIEAASRAVQIAPSNARALFNLGNVASLSGDTSIALEAYRRAVPLAPEDVRLLNNYANVLIADGQQAEALKIYQAAIATRPDDANLLNNFARALLDCGDVSAATQTYAKAAAIDPRSAMIQYGLSQALLKSASTEAGETLLDPLEIDSSAPIRDHNESLQAALSAGRKAVELAPSTAEFHQHLGNLFARVEMKAQAIAEYRAVIQLNPASIEAWNNLGVTLKAANDYDGAIEAYEQTLRLDQDFPIAWINLAGMRRETGQIEQAIADARRAVALQPDSPMLLSALILYFHFCPGDHTADLNECYRQWNERFTAPLALARPALRNDRDPDRKLRIGFVSPDFHDNPGGRFMVPIFEQHDPSRYEYFCYYNYTASDATTARLRSYAAGWLDITHMPDEAVVRRIREDHIDILVDLAMHARRGRMMLFSHKPAPVQVTYLAYVGTTGLSTMDYRLTDPFLDPPGNDSRYTEKSERLESYWCYPAPEIAPPINPPPADTNGYITFGSFNSFAKVSADVLDVWAKLLCCVPNSHLLLHCATGRHRKDVIDRFAKHGILKDRIEFFPLVSVDEYFRQLQLADIALDRFPYAGGTTTLDTLWMGVPVVTLASVEAHGRGGVSILSRLGMTACIASDIDEYVQIAERLANDRSQLRDLRHSLRDRMRDSVLMDAPRFAREIEAAFRRMWRSWCGMNA